LGDVSIVVFSYVPGRNGQLFHVSLEAPTWLPAIRFEALPDVSRDPFVPNGFIDIGVTDESVPVELFVGQEESQDHSDVLQMLSSLKYLPEDAHAEAITWLYGGTPSAAHELTGDAQSIVAAGPTDYLAADAVSQASARGAAKLAFVSPSQHESPEGGMVALAREVVIDQAVSAEPGPPVDIDSLLSVSVRMDSAYGRFQAFEISTSESADEAPFAPDRQSRTSPDSEARAPLTGSSANTPRSDVGRMPQNDLRVELTLASKSMSERSSTATGKLLDEPNQCHDTAETKDDSTEAYTPPVVPVPRDEDGKSLSLVKATAVAATLATVARFARPTTRVPEDRPKREMRWMWWRSDREC
jgi:hypothetical protein